LAGGPSPEPQHLRRWQTLARFRDRRARRRRGFHRPRPGPPSAGRHRRTPAPGRRAAAACPSAGRHPTSKRPDLHPGTEAELQQLAALCNLGLDGLRLATQRGLLRFAEHHGQPSWFVTDPQAANAQARRLDSQPWANGAKALTIAGSRAARPIGAHAAADFSIVLFCEGGPDLLAAHHLITVEARERDAVAVAMLGASLAIPAEDLPPFAGKRIRFFVHADEPGRASVQRWAHQLAAVAAAVDAVDFADLRKSDDSPVKDLNDLTSVHPDDFETHRALWSLVPPA
jgi:hypothetical protein